MRQAEDGGGYEGDSAGVLAQPIRRSIRERPAFLHARDAAPARGLTVGLGLATLLWTGLGLAIWSLL